MQFFCLLLITCQLIFLQGCAVSQSPGIKHRISSIDAVTKASPIPAGKLLSSDEHNIQIISAYEVRQKQIRHENFLLVDARSRQSYDSKHITGAISMPLSEIDQRYIELIPYDRELVLYCGGLNCPVSKMAAVKLKRMGFINIKDMAEGIDGWENLGYHISGGR